MKTKTPLHTATLLLALAVAGAGACGEPPSPDETDESVTTSAGDTPELSQEEANATNEVETFKAAITCVGMRNGSIKHTRIPAQWTGIIDNGCDRAVRVNVDIEFNRDPGCRTYAARTSHNVKWWAGLGSSGFRKVYECN